MLLYMVGVRAGNSCLTPPSCNPHQTEDKPLLPVGVEGGGVDRREWTLQHRKAADITLTPPQAEVDIDCLDVNVKGPGMLGRSKRGPRRFWIFLFHVHHRVVTSG